MATKLDSNVSFHYFIVPTWIIQGDLIDKTIKNLSDFDKNTSGCLYFVTESEKIVHTRFFLQR